MIRTPLILAAVLVAMTSSAFAAPRVAATETSFSFGDLYQGEKASHVFTFTNAGDTSLEIDKVRSSCGCTAAVVSTKTLQPGESGEIRATFDSARFRGPLTKKIYLYSNDPARKPFEFTLTTTVLELVALTPHRIVAEALAPGKPHTAEVELTNQGRSPLRIMRHEASIDGLEATLDRDIIPPGEKARLVLRLTPDGSQRRINGYLTLSTDAPLAPEVRIPLFYTVNLGATQ